MINFKHFILLSFCVLLIACSTETITPIVNAHAHNDYEHERPLCDALKNGFISVEVDVHLINDELYVSHFKPDIIDSSKTIERLYLDPLRKRIAENAGQVYKNYDGFFYLMVDIKTEAQPSYNRLKDILKNYHSIISIVKDGKEEKDKPVKIVITGMKGRPFEQILKAEPKYMSLDGRLNELKFNIPSSVMPYISENYRHYFDYNGEGIPSEKDIQILDSLVQKTHKQNKLLRFWASPDHPNVWQFLLNHRVDLVNTDSLTSFKSFYNNRKLNF